MADKVELVNIDLTAINKQIEDSTKLIVEQEEAIKSLRKESKKTDDQLKEEGKTREDINRQIAENNEELKDLKKQRSDNIKIVKAEINSLGQLEARNKALVTERKKLSKADADYETKLKAINDEIDTNNSKINEATGKQGSLTEAVWNQNDALGELTNQLEASSGGFGGLIGSMKSFLMNPYVAVFAAIAGAIVAIGASLKGSRAASVLMQKATTGLSATMDVAKKNFNAAVEEIASTEDGSKKLLKAFNPLKAVTFALTGNLKEGREEFKKQKNEIQDLRIALIDLNDAYIDIENELLTQIATQQGLADVQSAIADDATRSLAEQRDAAKEAFRLETEARQAAVDLAQEQLKLSRAEIELGIKQGLLLREQDGTIKSLRAEGIELEKAYTEASIAAIEASNALTISRINNQKRIAQINQDDAEQELDLLLDIADAQKTVNEQQIADTRLALGERKALLTETNALIEKSYTDQVALFERAFKVQLEENELLNLNNQEIVDYAHSLGLSEIATNRLREVIIERRKAVQDLAMAQRDLDEEEKQRTDAALERIKKHNENVLLAQTEGLEAQKELRIQWEIEEYERQKAQKGLLDVELEAIEAAHLDNMDAINAEYRQKQEDEDKKAAQKRKNILSQVVDFAQNANNTFFEWLTHTNQMSLDAQLAANEGNQEAQDRIRRKFAEKQKKAAVGQAIANAALAVIKALSTLGPIAGAVASAGIIATTGLQIAKIRAQEFKDGGEVTAFNVKGPSHSQGGIPLHIGGRLAGVMEGNEGVYVVNKRDNPNAIAQLSSINSKSGRAFSTPVRFAQEGGEIAGGGINEVALAEMLRNLNIQVSVTDINDAQAVEVEVTQAGQV